MTTKVSTIEDLMKLKGVAAAGEFSDDGRCLGYKANLPMNEEQAQMTAQFIATVSMMFKTLAGSYTQLSGMPWIPARGWAYSGGDWSVCVGGNIGLFVETAKADFNELFAALVGPRP